MNCNDQEPNAIYSIYNIDEHNHNLNRIHDTIGEDENYSKSSYKPWGNKARGDRHMTSLEYRYEDPPRGLSEREVSCR